MNNPIHIGIDAGGSKMEVLCRVGLTSHSLTLPSKNARISTTAETVDRLVSAVASIRTHIAAGQDSASGLAGSIQVCAGIAGAAAPDIQKDIQQGVAQSLNVPQSSIQIVSDARIAFEAAFLDPAESTSDGRILVICGTGSGCYSFDSDEHLLRTGGWGPTIGDPGSGIHLGTLLLRQALADLEAQTPSPFTQAVEAAFNRGGSLVGSHQLSVTDVLDQVYKNTYHVAQLAPYLLDLSASNVLAKNLIEQACTTLSIQIERLSTQLKAKSPTVRLTGGLNASSVYATMLQQAILDQVPNAAVSVSGSAPVLGALHLAQAAR